MHMRMVVHGMDMLKCIFGGTLRVFKICSGCPWDEYTCSDASSGGHLECLKYAHENDCKWNRNTCSNASSGGHLECLKYAHENDCPWDIYTCSNASSGGHLECLKYAQVVHGMKKHVFMH